MIFERTSKDVASKQQLTIQRDQQVEYVLVHDGSSAELERQFDLEENSKLKLVAILLGGDNSQFNLITNLRGKEASVEQYVLVVNSDQQITDSNIKANHNVGQTTSKTVVRKILDDNSQGSFNGLIYIAPEAQLSDGDLSDSVYLLSDSAKNRSIPSLEINANDVKAKHASAQSALNENDLLYLESRGVNSEEAKLMLVDGFAAKVYEEIKDPDIKKEVKQLIAKKIND